MENLHNDVINDENMVNNESMVDKNQFTLPNFAMEVYRTLMQDAYSIIDYMLPEDLFYLKRLIDEEIYLRKYNEKRINRMKAELNKEKDSFREKLIKDQQKLAKQYAKEKSDTESDEDSQSDENSQSDEDEIVVKPVKKLVKKPVKKPVKKATKGGKK